MLLTNAIMHVRVFTRVVCFLIRRVSQCLFNLSLWSWTLRFGELLDVHGSLGYLLGWMVNLSSSRGVVHVRLGWRYQVVSLSGVHFETTLSCCFDNWNSFGSLT